MSSPGERLVTVLVTLAVPAEADAEDAAGLVADAAASTALEVVAAAGVEGHLPVPGSLVLRRAGGQPWRVAAVCPGSRDPGRPGRQLGPDAADQAAARPPRHCSRRRVTARGAPRLTADPAGADRAISPAGERPGSAGQDRGGGREQAAGLLAAVGGRTCGLAPPRPPWSSRPSVFPQGFAGRGSGRA